MNPGGMAMDAIPLSQFVTAQSVLPWIRAPCSSLLSNWHTIGKMPVPQAFLTFLAMGSLFFSKITLILVK